MIKVFRQIVNASRYSYEGLVYMLRNELAARIEIYALVCIFGLFFLASASAENYLIGLALFMMVLSVEAINTAIEVIIDRVSPEISPTGKHAKDLGSFSVLCLSLTSLGYAIYVLITADWTLLKSLF